MATRSPEQSTHQYARLPISGSHTIPSYVQSRSGLRYGNCVPRTIKQNGTDPIRVLEKVGWFDSSSVIPEGSFDSVRGAHGTAFATTVYSVLALENTVYINTVAEMTLVHSNGYVGFADAVIAGNRFLVALESHASAARIHVFDYSTSLETVVNLGVGAQGNPVFLNGRIYVAGWRNQRIYNSAVGDLTSWAPANDYIDAEQIGDTIVTLGLHRNHVVAFGTHSIEFLYDAAIDIGSPLQRNETYSTQIGMQNKDWETNNNLTSAIAVFGNDLYFNGNISGVSVICRLRDFKVTKISDSVIDRLLNSTLVSPLLHTIFPVMSYGRPFVYFALYNGQSNVYIGFSYCIEEDLWIYWDPPISISFKPKFGFVGWASLDIPSSIYVGIFDGDVYAFDIFSLNETAVAPIANSVLSYMIFDTFDGGTEFQKHIKFVDVIGDLGDNTVTLYYTKDASKEALPITPQNDSPGNPIRFRNLGRARRVNFTIFFSGKTQIEFRGLDVYYNLGTH